MVNCQYSIKYTRLSCTLYINSFICTTKVQKSYNYANNNNFFTIFIK